MSTFLLTVGSMKVVVLVVVTFSLDLPQDYSSSLFHWGKNLHTEHWAISRFNKYEQHSTSSGFFSLYVYVEPRNKLWVCCCCPIIIIISSACLKRIDGNKREKEREELHDRVYAPPPDPCQMIGWPTTPTRPRTRGGNIYIYVLYTLVCIHVIQD